MEPAVNAVIYSFGDLDCSLDEHITHHGLFAVTAALRL